jgi:hypothetical protein
VPISVRTLNDNVISIWVDPAETMNHFAACLIALQVYVNITKVKFVSFQSPAFVFHFVMISQ